MSEYRPEPGDRVVVVAPASDARWVGRVGVVSKVLDGAPLCPVETDLDDGDLWYFNFAELAPASHEQVDRGSTCAPRPGISVHLCQWFLPLRGHGIMDARTGLR